MKNLHCEILIDKPIDAVFTLYTDFHNYPKWSKYVDEVIEHEDPNCWTWKASAGPFPFKLETEIVETRLNELIVWRGWRSNWEDEGRVHFVAIDDDVTRMEVTIDYHPNGLIEKVVEATNYAVRLNKSDLKHFKMFAEEMIP